MLTNSKAYLDLKEHYLEIKDLHLKDLFLKDQNRFENFSTKQGYILLDYSKNRINQKTKELLSNLAEEAQVKEYAKKMVLGEKINFTEKRAVLHTALRGNLGANIDYEEILTERNKMLQFAEDIRTGAKKTAQNKPFLHVVNIGIGGSDLGPHMVYEALKFYANGPDVHFVSNVDGTHLKETLKKIDITRTLFLVASKTFTTEETMTNAYSARDYLIEALGEASVFKHFAAMSTNINAVKDFGINPENVFGFWDFVGGRYSLWSVIGLPIAIAIGEKGFLELLEGAHAMDLHFLEADTFENLPMILGLLGIWYSNFFNCQTQAILPYDQYLSRFTAHFQQVDMESNGKYINFLSQEVDYNTGSILFGEPGTNGQHAFYQLIHQGSHLIPCDFIGFIKSLNPINNNKHHKILMSHFFAQTEALAFGLDLDSVKLELKAQNLNEQEIERLAPHKVFKGNRPTNTLLLDKLTPFSLGSLIALYEHKIFVQGIIWQVNSFDQWGVELGKKLAKKILPELNGEISNPHDQSTSNLIKYFKEKDRL